MRTCVIGGGGFIGRYLVEQLIDSGRDVVVLGRRAERPFGLNVMATYVHCDYNDTSLLHRNVCECTEIVDLAYATVPQTSFANPIFDLKANLAPSVALLEVAKDLRRLRKLVITSSGGTVYGPASRLPITEEDNTSPISPYGITKLTIERYALMFHRLFGLPVNVVRPSNAYGRGQRPFIGQGFVATAMGRILRDEVVTIFGENGTIRDYIHAKDIASGILHILNKGEIGEIYNIGSGVGLSNREVLRKIESYASRDGFQIKIACESARSYDVPANVLSYAKILNHSGWRPSIPFELGLEDMWESMREIIGANQ